MKLWIALLLLAFACLPALALTEQLELDGVRLTVYAPDWTWQRQNVNVLFVAENAGPDASDVSIQLVPPAGLEAHFKLPEQTVLTFKIAPGETVRRAFTDIHANDGVPRQAYPFEFTIASGSQSRRVPYALQTVRGAAVSSARWALYVPVVVALVWSLMFAAVLPRLAVPSAWRTSKTVDLDDPKEEEARG